MPTLAALAAIAQEKLDLARDGPILQYAGHPGAENVNILSCLGAALHLILRGNTVPRMLPPTLIVSRHPSDTEERCRSSGALHHDALRMLRDSLGIRVIEYSVYHAQLPATHPDAVPMEFWIPPDDMPTEQEMLALCALHGSIVTGPFLSQFVDAAVDCGTPVIQYVPDDATAQLRCLCSAGARAEAICFVSSIAELRHALEAIFLAQVVDQPDQYFTVRK